MSVSAVLGQEEHEPEHQEHEDHTPMEKHEFEEHLHDIKKGALHRMLHVPVGQDIPAERLEEATHSRDPLERKRAIMAEAMRHWSHGHSSPHDEYLGVK